MTGGALQERYPLLSPEYAEGFAVATELHRLEQALGVLLPSDYRQFMLISNGYSGPVGANGHDAYLWSVVDILSGGYEGPAEAGVILIGTNGGPTGYGFMSSHTAKFVSIPLGTSDPEEIRVLGHCFTEFLQALADGGGW